ncbi:hypothetical protein J6590_068897 [Homalodisca vitripennis]|nr:hypothetical protein J6590_068897 [Homalodisca vitripennis]
MAFKKKAIALGAEYITGDLDHFKFRRMSDIVMDNIPLGEYEGLNEAICVRGVSKKYPTLTSCMN